MNKKKMIIMQQKRICFIKHQGFNCGYNESCNSQVLLLLFGLSVQFLTALSLTYIHKLTDKHT